VPSRRRIKFGDIAKFAEVPAELPKVTAADLKKPIDFRIIGKDPERLDIPSKTDGSATFGIDVQVPDMIYATVLRTPVEGAELDALDDRDAMGVPGMLRVVRFKDAAGVLAVNQEAVFAARNLLKATWKGGATAGYDSGKALAEFVARARNLQDKGASFHRSGDVDTALARAHKVLRAEFQSDYVYHAQLEPMNITARVSGDEADLWVGTQAQTGYAAAAARFLDTKPENIRIHQQMLGGGFGRRAVPDLVPYVLALAKLTGKPVKLIWPREEDVKAAKNRPMTAHFLEAGLDERGAVIAWRHRLAAEGRREGLDGVTLSGIRHNYEFGSQSIEYLREGRGVALGAWRATGAGYNKFAIEAFVDELARAWGEDPVVFRLRRMQQHPRGRRVLETVAQMANWGAAPAAGRAFGVAYVDVHGTPAAAVAEVSLDAASGAIRVHNFWNAINPGIVVNPDGVVAQCEGGIVFGLSHVLKERISFAGGAVMQSNFHDYEVLRLSEVPEIRTQVISTDDRPTGVGEIATPLVAPAVANAVFALTGKRLRHLPFTPDRVKAALGA
jgi:isoquinoline 1-oxidoreductase beta subunit